MRVLLFTSDRQPGGMQRALVDQLSALLALDMVRSVHVLAPPSEFLQFASAFRERVTTQPIGAMDRLGLRRFPARAPRLNSAARFDLALVHNGYACAALKRCAERVIGVCHSAKADNFAAADHLLCLTPAHRQQVIAAGWDVADCSVLPHSYQTQAEQIKPAAAPAKIRIGAAGRMVEKKDFALFIRAAAKLNRLYPQLSFVLAGSGHLQRRLRRDAKRLGLRLDWPGWVEIDQLAQSLDIFCLPSKQEPFGYVLAEMMDHGVAVVASDTYGASWILDQGAVAPLFPVGDCQRLVAILSDLVEHPDRLRALQQACYGHIRSDKFSPQLQRASLGRLLSSLV